MVNYDAVKKAARHNWAEILQCLAGMDQGRLEISTSHALPVGVKIVTDSTIRTDTGRTTVIIVEQGTVFHCFAR